MKSRGCGPAESSRSVGGAQSACRRGPPATAVNSGRYVCLGTAFAAAYLHLSAQPEGALGKSEAWNRGWEAGFPCRKWAWRSAAGVLVGRGAARGRGLRAVAGAVVPARAPPPRGAQCQAGGDSGWRLHRALHWGPRRRRLRQLSLGEQRAPDGPSRERAERVDLSSQHVQAPADRSRRAWGRAGWRGVG